MTLSGRRRGGQAAWLLAALLLASASCQPPPLIQSQSRAASVAWLVVSEMREESSTVWAVNVANLQDKRVLASFPHQPGFPIRGAVSPDGGSIALVQLPPGADRFSGARLLVMGADGSGQRVLEERVDYDVLPQWSPDGKEVAFLRRSQPTPPAAAPGGAEAPPAAPAPQVYAVGADGKNRRLLFQDAQALDLYLVAWHPDGRRLLYRRFSGAGDELWAFDLVAGRAQLLSKLSQVPVYGVHLSPDGVGLVASVRQGDSYDVISQSLAGQDRRVLSQGNRRPSNPLYTPDGRRIAFDTELPQQASAVGIMEAGAQSITRLSSPEGGKEVPLLFSPDGERLLLRHDQDGRARTLILRLKDGAKEYLDTAYWVEPIGWPKG